MRYKWLFILLALWVVSLTVGCSPAPAPAPLAEPPAQEAPAEAVPEPEPEPAPVPESLLNGLPIDDAYKIRRPIAVMLDNHIGARPQAGLAQADVVVEALAEGEITRYMALFQSQDPETIGSVRSARPYFVDMALGYDALYVHAGGSPQALSDIVKLGVADIDSLHEGKVTFWRRNHKKAPHNLYTSPAAVRSAASARKYRTDWKGVAQQFAYEGLPKDGTAFRQVNLRFKEPRSSDKVGYTASFTVSLSDGRMMRSVNGQAHTDENTQAPVYAENLLILQAKHKVVDSAGRLDVSIIGTGEGYYCGGGQYWPIQWQKKDPAAQLTVKLADGSPLLMKPGVLWIEIFPTDRQLVFE